MTSLGDYPKDGGCACGDVRFRMKTDPLFVHCCHCRWCQRESGSAFALNALIETDRLDLLSGAPARVKTPSESGKGQVFIRCPACRVALWSHYAGAGDAVAFIRVGALDRPEDLSPDVHIFAASKLPWVRLGDDVPVCDEYYRWKDLWPAASQARRAGYSSR